MNRRYVNLIIIVLILAASLWADFFSSPFKIGEFERSMKTILGLDLQGGMQVLLEADVAADQTVDADAMENARQILENRSNGLGVSEVVFQVAGERRIVGEFPGLKNTEDVIKAIKETGQMEFADLGDTYLAEGTVIKTDYGAAASADPASTPVAETTPVVTPTAVDAVAGTEATPAATPETEKVYHTIMTGDQLSEVSVSTDELGAYVVDFVLKPEGTEIFKDYTTNNVGKYLAIVLDKKVISAPSINTPITKGQGQISGKFDRDSANTLAITMRYGSLPVSLKVIESRIVGPSLGQDSLNKSLLAGAIGFAIVALFMIIYYRTPGLTAIVAIVIYGLITLALYKILPVTLTLPGIAGFLLSTGSALDANILYFERFKEELHNGRSLIQAADLGWKRAWSSIRDSNIATLITSAILFWYGSNFGATLVKGFALTLALGVVISVFAAFFITRTIFGFVVENFKPDNRETWYGA